MTINTIESVTILKNGELENDNVLRQKEIDEIFLYILETVDRENFKRKGIHTLSFKFPT